MKDQHSSQSNTPTTHVGKSASNIVDLAKKDLKEKEVSLKTSKNALRSAHQHKSEKAETN
jgi:hypothetical protein